MNLSSVTRFTAVAVVALAAGTFPTPAHAVAVCEPSDCARPAAASSYADPLVALSGRTLAQVLADHQARVLGPLAF